jgi:capsular polysaccharide biosynthesis protein
MRDMANFFLRHYGIGPSEGGGGRRIYISRAGVALRRVKNETALVEMLSRYGFESHDPGRIPFSEQAALFQSADVIVAPHGAALANLMFCRPGTRVLEFFPANFSEDCFLRMSKAMGFEYRHLIGGRGAPPKLAFQMDQEQLEAAVKSLVGSSGKLPG